MSFCRAMILKYTNVDVYKIGVFAIIDRPFQVKFYPLTIE